MVKAIIGVFLTLIVLNGYFIFKSVNNENLYLKSLADLKTTQVEADNLKLQLETLQSSYKTISEQLMYEQISAIELREANQRLDSDLQKSLNTIQELRNDKVFRDWSNHDLPVNVVRMLNESIQEPAIRAK